VQDWIQQILSSSQAGMALYPAMFLLGLLGSVTSCCALPVIGAVVGYAGSRDTRDGIRDLWLTGLFFMLGTMLSLAALGLLTGLVGNVGSTAFGRLWQFCAGILIVLFGLASLKLLPVGLPKFNFAVRVQRTGLWGAMIYGLVLGGSTTACSVGCNPLLPMAIGAVVLKGTIIMGAVALAVFAFGYSLPLTAGLIGISFGVTRLSQAAQRVVPVIQMAGGVLLIGAGFYLLATL
jgi:cytochrome c biogenesis protein CcdA